MPTHLDETSDYNQLMTYIREHKVIEYVDVGENIGFGSAHNLAIRATDACYHAIVNPDIIVLPGAIEQLCELLNRDSDIGISVPKLVDSNGNIISAYRTNITVLDVIARNMPKWLFAKRKRKHMLGDCDFSQELEIPFAQGSFLMCRTGMLKSLGGFDETFFLYLEDADLCKRVWGSGYKIVYTPNALVVHNWERGSHSNKALRKQHLSSFRKYFKKWGIKYW